MLVAALLSPSEEETERFGELPRAMQLERARARIRIPVFLLIVQFFLHCAFEGCKKLTATAKLSFILISPSLIQAYNFLWFLYKLETTGQPMPFSSGTHDTFSLTLFMPHKQ